MRLAWFEIAEIAATASATTPSAARSTETAGTTEEGTTAAALARILS